MRFVALLAVLAACERADDPGTARLVMPPHAEIIVFEPGREPRAPLRTAPISGRAREELVTTQTFRGEPARHSRVVYANEVAVDGERIHHHQRIESIAVDPAPQSYDPATLVGTVMDGWTDRRGRWLGPAISHSRFTDPSVQRVEMMLVDPEEPVGVGARWREDIAVGTSHATTTVTLVARDNGHVKLELAYEREAPGASTPYAVNGTATVEYDERQIGSSTRGTNLIRPLAKGSPVAGDETFDVRAIR